MDISQYKFDIQQVGPFHFDVNVTTPENLVFTNKGIQAMPGQINNELLFKHFLDKNNRNNWALNIEVVIVEDKPEIVEPKIEEKQVIEIGPEITDKPIEIKPEIIKDEVEHESKREGQQTAPD